MTPQLTRVPVRALARGEEDAALATLVAAFADDPVARWTWPDAGAWRARFTAFARAFGGRAFAFGTADGAGGADGVALWLPPRVAPDEDAVVAALTADAPPARRDELLAMLEQMGRAHPEVPHWHLPLIGVTPAGQGRGLGGALLRHALARCDREHLPACLEATSPRNVPLYQRHGFEVVATIRVGSSPPLFSMVRPAR